MCVYASVCMSGYLLPNYLIDFIHRSLIRKLVNMPRKLSIKIRETFTFC